MLRFTISVLISMTVLANASFAQSKGDDYAQAKDEVRTLLRIACYRDKSVSLDSALVVLDQVLTPVNKDDATVYYSGRQFRESKRTESMFRIRVFPRLAVSTFDRESVEDKIFKAEKFFNFNGLMLKRFDWYSINQDADQIKFRLIDEKWEESAFVLRTVERGTWGGSYSCLEPYEIPNPLYRDTQN